MAELKLPKNTLTLWKLRALAATLLFLGLLSYFCHGYRWFLFAVLIIICLFEAIIFWYLPCLFKNYKIEYISGAVVVTYGVIIKTTHIMPFSKLIYAETMTSPMAKFLGLKAVTLKAARSRILIPELLSDDAERFVKTLAEDEE